MIIQTKAIKASSGAGKTASHIFAGDKNEKIERLEGGDFQMKDAMRQAENNKLKYGFHHIKISPREYITKEQLNETINKLSQEYKFNRDDVTLVEHTKNRADKTASNKHYHLIVPHYQADRRKALDTKNSYARNEKIARICEIEFGHELTQGQHNSAVFRQLMDEGKTPEAKRVKPLIDRDRTHQAHTVNHQRTAEKNGIDLPKEKQAIKALWKASDGMKAFKSSLQNQGYEIKAGQKANTYIIEKNGLFVGSANRLIGMKKEEFTKKIKELENVGNIQKKQKIRFKQEHTEEENRHTEKNTNIKRRFNNTEQKDTSEHRQNLKSSRNNRDTRREFSSNSFRRNQKQSNIDIERDKRIKRELNKLKRDIYIKKQINKYHSKKEKELSDKLKKIEDEYEIIQKILDEIFHKLFGTQTQRHRDCISNLIKYNNKNLNQETLKHIVNNELKEVSFPKIITEDRLKKLSDNQKNKEELEIKSVYSHQKKFINDLNKNYNLKLPNPSFSEFLTTHQERNSLCKSMIKDELQKENKEKSINKIKKYIDKCEENTRLKHKITDIETIRKDISDNLFSSYKSSINDYDKIEKEFNSINIKFLDKYFNKEKINHKNSLYEKLNNLKDEMNKKEDKYNHFSNFENEISKSESDKRIKENDEIKNNWKYKKSLENLPVLKNLQSRLSMNNNELIDKINNGELKNILSDEIQKIKDSQLEEQKKNIEQKENVLTSEKCQIFQMKR